MRTIQDVYTHYKINSGLQLHQLRVAAVGAYIARVQKTPIDERSVILACLLHDMGNILKADFSDAFASLFEPEGMEYWKGIQKEFRTRYGSNEHDATTAIVKDVGVPRSVEDLIAGMGFSKAPQVLAEGTRELWIVEYADQRVAPQGIVSARERWDEGYKRYKARTDGKAMGISDDATILRSIPALEEIERRLFQDTGVRPEDLTDESVGGICVDLRNYPVA